MQNGKHKDTNMGLIRPGKDQVDSVFIILDEALPKSGGKKPHGQNKKKIFCFNYNIILCLFPSLCIVFKLEIFD